MMTEVTGLAETSVTWVLALFGIGMTLGTLIAGPLTDRAPRRTLYAALGLMAVLMVAFHFAAPVKWAALLLVGLLGAVGFLITTPVQML
ncbi:MFS transporter, partial [Streptomyces nanshensis]